MEELAVYCARSWRISTYLTTRVRPITSPPVFYSEDLAWLKAEIVYIRLHGIVDQPYLYNDEWSTALAAKHVEQADFEGCNVFMEGCHGIQFSDAFLTAGASSVTGCSESTWGRKYFLGASSKVGKEWLKRVRAGQTAGRSLALSMSQVPAPFNAGWSTTQRS